MTLQFWSVFSGITIFLIWLGTPFYFFWRRSKDGKPNYGWRFIGAICAVWLGLILQRALIDLPVSLAHARAAGNENFDGATINAVLLKFGWFYGFISTTFAFFVFLGVEFFKRRKSTKARGFFARYREIVFGEDPSAPDNSSEFNFQLDYQYYSGEPKGSSVSQSMSEGPNAYCLYAGDVLLGTSLLNQHDQSMGFRMGMFYPSPGYTQFQPLFRNYSHITMPVTSPSIHGLNYASLDKAQSQIHAFGLRIVRHDGVEVPTNSIVLTDVSYALPEEGMELTIHLPDGEIYRRFFPWIDESDD